MPISLAVIDSLEASRIDDCVYGCRIDERLRAHGLRPTKQRLVIAAHLFKQSRRHVHADMLYEEIAATGEIISVATIYNSLRHFCAVGLIRAVASRGTRQWFCTDISNACQYYFDDGEHIEPLEDFVPGLMTSKQGPFFLHKSPSAPPWLQPLGIPAGYEIAHRGEAFGMQVGYYNRRAKDNVAWRYYRDVHELAWASDVLAVAIAATAETEKMISAAVLRELGAQGSLVNIARGAVIDEVALIEALKAKKIAGAGLDVFYNEPDINPAFFILPNVVLAPHQGSATVETRLAMGQNVVDNIHSFLTTGRPLTAISVIAPSGRAD